MFDIGIVMKSNYSFLFLGPFLLPVLCPHYENKSFSNVASHDGDQPEVLRPEDWKPFPKRSLDNDNTNFGNTDSSQNVRTLRPDQNFFVAAKTRLVIQSRPCNKAACDEFGSAGESEVHKMSEEVVRQAGPGCQGPPGDRVVLERHPARNEKAASTEKRRLHRKSRLPRHHAAEACRFPDSGPPLN